MVIVVSVGLVAEDSVHQAGEEVILEVTRTDGVGGASGVAGGVGVEDGDSKDVEAFSKRYYPRRLRSESSSWGT